MTSYRQELAMMYDTLEDIAEDTGSWRAAGPAIVFLEDGEINLGRTYQKNPNFSSMEIDKYIREKYSNRKIVNRPEQKI